MRDPTGPTNRATRIPALPTTYVDRPSLIDAIDRAVASGPAMLTGGPGWGKTTTAAAWAARRAAGWLTLDHDDSLPHRLANRILAAARRRRPDLPSELVIGGSTQAMPALPVTATVDALVQLLAGVLDRDLPIVLDGIHQLSAGSAGARLLAGLCRRAPPELRLVLLTRHGPAKPLVPASGLPATARIGPERLAFTTDEIAAFLKASLGRADPVEVGEVWALTVGWPTAVRLAAQALPTARAAGPAVGHRPRSTAKSMLDTFAAWVLEPEPEPARNLLTTAAVLGGIDVSLAEALGHHDAATLVPVLDAQGLLWQDTSDPAYWSVVPPVRDLLVDHMGAGSPAARDLHARAAVHQEDHARYGRALRHLTEAGDRQAVERLLVERGDTLVAQGDAAAVVSAAGRTDPRSADPRLLTVLGRAHQVQGDWLGALACLRAAAGDGALGPALALRLGQLYYLTGRVDRAIEVFQRARLGDEVGPDGIRLLCEAAIWLRAAGQDDQARIAAARGAEAAERCADPATLASCHRVLALLAAHDGDRPANDLHHEHALRLARDLDDGLLQLGLLINRSSYLVEEGSPAEALDTVDAALHLGRELAMAAYEPFCHSIRGRANARLGRFADALADVDAAQHRWREIGPSLDIAFGLLVRGDVHCRRGEPSQAQAVLEEALRATTDTAGMRPLRALALATLARARAADDLPAARTLAGQAVTLASGTGRVPALLALGWIVLLCGDRTAAAAHAAQARATAGTRRDHGGLAEALELTALSAPRPGASAGLLDEAAALWRDLDDPVGAARVRLVAARLAGPAGRAAADVAAVELRAHGVRLDSGVADASAVPVARAPITVQTLGAFQVLRAGVPIPAGSWRSRKARDLFKILVTYRGQPLSRERLMDMLWPDEPTQRTANRLSVLLSTLRIVLDPDRAMPEPGPVLADRDTVALDPTLIDSDLDTFLTTARAALAADRRGDPEALHLLEAAEAAYTGELLPDLTYAEWSQPIRDSVRTTHISVLRALTRHATGPERREQHLLQLLRHDPYDEQSHRQLIHVLRAAGRHGEARRRYEDYLKRMVEIGVTPRPLTRPR